MLYWFFRSPFSGVKKVGERPAKEACNDSEEVGKEKRIFVLSRVFQVCKHKANTATYLCCL